jgi:hypothetical protein
MQLCYCHCKDIQQRDVIVSALRAAGITVTANLASAQWEALAARERAVFVRIVVVTFHDHWQQTAITSTPTISLGTAKK